MLNCMSRSQLTYNNNNNSVTVCITVADSYLAAASHAAGAVAEQAADKKCLNCQQLMSFSQWQLRHTGH